MYALSRRIKRHPAHTLHGGGSSNLAAVHQVPPAGQTESPVGTIPVAVLENASLDPRVTEFVPVPIIADHLGKVAKAVRAVAPRNAFESLTVPV